MSKKVASVPVSDVVGIAVDISGRDLAHLDDCDDMVHDLVGNASSVSVYFAPHNLDCVRQKISSYIDSWGTLFGKPSDVALIEHREGKNVLFSLKHKRGLPESKSA